MTTATTSTATTYTVRELGHTSWADSLQTPRAAFAAKAEAIAHGLTRAVVIDDSTNEIVDYECQA